MDNQLFLITAHEACVKTQEDMNLTLQALQKT